IPGTAGPRCERKRGRDPAHQARERGLGARHRRHRTGRADASVTTWRRKPSPASFTNSWRMRELTAQDVVTLWEQGRGRHAIDRALLLFAAACPELPPEHLADLPLGQRNEALFRLREWTFGPDIRTYADCPACGGRN